MRNYLHHIASLLVSVFSYANDEYDISCYNSLLNGVYIVKSNLHFKTMLKAFNSMVDDEIEFRKIDMEDSLIKPGTKSLELELNIVKKIISSIKEIDSDGTEDGEEITFSFPMMSELMYKNVTLAQYVYDRFNEHDEDVWESKYGKDDLYRGDEFYDLLPHTEEEISLINKWINQEK